VGLCGGGGGGGGGVAGGGWGVMVIKEFPFTPFGIEHLATQGPGQKFSLILFFPTFPFKKLYVGFPIKPPVKQTLLGCTQHALVPSPRLFSRKLGKSGSFLILPDSSQ